MKNPYKTFISRSLIIVSTILTIACDTKKETVEQEEQHTKKENSVELTQAQYDQASIQIGQIEKRKIGSELVVNGTIEVPPRNNVSINMPYGGFLTYTQMLPGTKIKKGQLLATIENPDFIQFQEDYLGSLVNKEFLKAEFERQQKLYDEKVASGKTYQQAKSRYLSNETKIKAMEERLKIIGFNVKNIRRGQVSGSVNIYAPVSGAIREVYTNVGKYVGPRDVIMDITNSDDLHVELTVYENDIPKLQIGQHIRFALSNSTDKWREAEVFLVGSGVREDRSVTVHGHLKKTDDTLLPGMYVTARIETHNKESWVVPEASIVRFAGKQYIFKYVGQKTEDKNRVHDFEMIAVTVSDTEEGYVGIPLADSTMELENIKLVTSGAFSLLAQAKNKEKSDGH